MAVSTDPAVVATTPPIPRPPSAVRPKLANSDWTLWNHAMLRSAGFPVEGPLRLADEALASAADDLAGDEQRRHFEALWRGYTEARVAETVGIAADPTFRLALTWQNRKILDNAIEPFLAQTARGERRTHKMRAREQIIASYWQRYCTKCESIGFFGPTTWASVGASGPVVAASHGPSLIDHRAVFFEAWPVDRLARTLERDHDLRRWMAPRRAPHIRTEGDTVLLPNGGRERIDTLSHYLLSKVDGRMRAADLAAAAAADHPTTTPEQVLQTLAALHRKGWVIWKFELRPTVRPEAELRAFLDGLEPAVRRPALARLDALEQARDAVADAFLDPERLGPALAALDEVFVETTGAAATRNDGQTYGGRTLVYPECRRDLAAGFGPGLVDAMAPLTLILDSIRWLLHRVGESVLALVRVAYDSLVARHHAPPSAAMLWTACTAILGGQLSAVTGEALAELQRRWHSVLRVPADARSVEFRLDDIRQAVAHTFASPPARWTDARWCCPDLMIAAQSEDAIRAGRFRLVLGEVHAGVNTVDYCSMVPLHPRPEDLMACVDEDHPQSRLMVALPQESRPRMTPRSHPVLIRDTDHRLVVMPHVPIPVHGQVHLGADVPVLSDADGLYLSLPDGSRFGVLDLFANAIRGEVAQAFDLYPNGKRPRIVVDQMVIARERWWLRAADLDFANIPDEAERFAGCRAWMRRYGLPRRVFVKSQLETKPFYVDFASPVFVELLVAAVRRAAREGTDVHLGFTEMLPDLDEAWLTDAAGRRYVSELRFVAFDTRPAQSRS